MKITMKQLPAALRYLIAEKIPVLVTGAPGVGKSAVPVQLAGAMKKAYVKFVASLHDPVDLMGLPVPDLANDTTRWLKPDDLPQEKRDGKEGILILEEVTAVGPAMQTALYGLVLDRQVGSYTLPDGWAVVANGNRIVDRASAQRLNTALRNRFEHLEVEVDVDAWVEWANQNSIDHSLIAFVRFRPELLHVMPQGDEMAYPTPRSIAMCSRMLKAPEAIRPVLIAGAVGDNMAAELEGFLRIVNSLPTVDEIVKSPDKAKVPGTEQPAALYAVASALARKATQKNIAAIDTYLARLPREFQVLGMVDAVRRDKDLCNTAGFTSWAVRNQDVTI